MGGLIQFLVTFGLIILAVILVAQTAIKILKEYERGVIFRLGRLQAVKGPGIFFIIPFVDRMVKVDLRVITLDIPTQEAITRDNVTVKVNAVTFFRVVDPGKAIQHLKRRLVLDYLHLGGKKKPCAKLHGPSECKPLPNISGPPARTV